LIDRSKLVGPFRLVHRLVLLFSDVCRDVYADDDNDDTDADTDTDA